MAPLIHSSVTIFFLRPFKPPKTFPCPTLEPGNLTVQILAMDQPSTTTEPEKPQRHISSVTPAELAQVDLEAPLADSQSFDHRELGDLYLHAAQAAEKDGRASDALVYALFQSLLHIHFKPGDRAEPFGAEWVIGDRRSILPQDLSPELIAALADQAKGFKHPVLKARIADLAWSTNRKLGFAAADAVDGYCASIEQLRAGTLDRKRTIGDVTDYETVERLRRAAQIAVVTKGKAPFPPRLTALITATREDARNRNYLPGFYQAATLDLDFELSEPTPIAQEAEALVAGIAAKGDGHLPLSILELSCRAFQDAGDQTNADRITLETAEFCVRCSESFAKAPMLEAHWLTRAIGILGRARSQKARRSELRKRLIDVQAQGLDDFAPIGTSIDIRDIVEEVQRKVSGASLSTALKLLLLATRSPDPDTLRRQAEEGTKNSLASVFSTQVLDNDGKVKFVAPGMSGRPGSDNQDQLRFEIMQHESLRRGLFVRSTLNPARAIVNAEHRITSDLLLPLVSASPFAQPGHEFVLAQGFARWFNGDAISAVSILVPQLENALRYILKNAGEDVSVMRKDGTQQDRSLKTLFDDMRPQIVEIMGEPIAFEIENLFLLPAGPAVRHGLAHGVYSTGHFLADDAAYACWFVYQLCFLPLLAQWAEVSSALDD